MTDKAISSEDDIQSALRNISTQDFMSFGLQQIAYIRPFMSGAERQYIVYSADGQELDAFKTRDEAIVSARRKDLEPVITH